MKAIIIAAGMGRRLRPHTDRRPKCMVEIAGKPILHHQLDAFRAHGVDDIVIIRGYKAAQVWGIVPGESMATTLSREPCKVDIADNENFGEAIGFLGNDGSYVTTTEAVNAPIRFYTS